MEVKKVEADRRVVETPGTFSQDYIPGFRMCKNGVRAKETEADIAEHVFFQKDNMNLKHWMYFFESAFEDLSFHSFLKASDWDWGKEWL